MRWWSAETSGPIWVCSSAGSPTANPATAGSSSSMNRSKALRCTRIRDRAQQSCPALSNTAPGAAAAARSRSASANTMFAFLPPSSSVTRFTCRAQPAMIAAAHLGRPGEDDLAHGGGVDEALAHDRALPGDHLEDALRQTGLQRQLGQPQRGQRGQLGRLEHDRVARREGRRQPPAGDRHREVPRHDDPDDAERLLEGDVDAAAHRDLPSGQPLRGRGVVVQDVADVARLPPRVADRVAGVGHLELRQLLDVGVDLLGEPAQQASAVGRVDRPPGRQRSGGAGDRGVGLLGGRGRDGRQHLLGGRVDQLGGRGHDGSSCGGGTSELPGRLHEGDEQPVVVGVQLGVPLHAEDELGSRELDGLDRPVLGPRRGAQARTQPVDGLVVVAGHVDASPTTAASALPASTATCTRPCCASAGRWTSEPTTSGRCWCSEPPVATFSTCAPRQTPSTGTPRASASPTSASSQASRSRRGGSLPSSGTAP